MNMTVLFKKYTYGLLLIATTIVGLLNFCSAGNLYDMLDNYSGLYSYSYQTINTNRTNVIDYTNFKGENLGAGTYCIKFQGTSNEQQLLLGFANSSTGAPNNTYTLYADQWNKRICLYGNKQYLNVKGTTNATKPVNVFNLANFFSEEINCPTCPTIDQNYCTSNNLCPNQLTKLQCQTEYNLIPIEDIDQEYCTSENLCPIIEGTGDIQRSALYINNVQHLSNDKIYITIPEEIERDYININDETDIEVIGYGYDQNAMQEMVNTQFTPPTSTDMEEIIAKIADFLPLLAVGLLFVWTWYIIKKVFRKGF